MRTDEQTDRHDEAKSRFSQFCENAWKSKNISIFDKLQAPNLISAIICAVQTEIVMSGPLPAP